MKKLFTYFLIIGTIIMASCSFADDVLSKIKEIDDQMYHGTIEYNVLSESRPFNEPQPLQGRQLIAYSSNGNYKEEDRSLGIRMFYNDDTAIQLNESYIRLMTKEKNIKSSRILGNTPSMRYGRGLSELSDIKFDSSKNIVTGIFGGDRKIVAEVDPSYQYIADNITVYNNKGIIIGKITNSKPVLVDDKYYIYSNSVYSNMIVKNNDQTIEIISATFKEPDAKNLVFDRDKYNDIRAFDDFRLPEGVSVTYEKGEIPLSMSYDDILKESQKRMEAKKKETSNSQDN